jgi:putative transposase
MPAKNARKQYLPQSYYHIYNRGVEKRKIFLDKQDYAVFLTYLKEYLTEKDETSLLLRLEEKIDQKERDKIYKQLRLNNFFKEITLLAYCLKPNHFHFLVKQRGANSIDNFMNSFSTRYSIYFNYKYERVGPLYQGVYCAARVKTDEQLLLLSQYIHAQGIKSVPMQGQALHRHEKNNKQIVGWQEVCPCSFPEYNGLRKTKWINTKTISHYFSKNNKSLSYQSFVLGDIVIDDIKGLTLE